MKIAQYLSQTGSVQFLSQKQSVRDISSERVGTYVTEISFIIFWN